MKTVIFILPTNTLDKKSGMSEHTLELYSRYKNIQFTEYSLNGETYIEQGNVKRIKLNKKAFSEISKMKGEKIFFLTFDRRFSNLKNINLHNEVSLIDHGTWPNTFLNKDKFKNVPINKKIWAYWNFSLSKSLKKFIENSNVISFSSNDLSYYETNKRKIEFIPFFEIPNLEMECADKIEEVNPFLLNIARPSFQKGTMDIAKWAKANDKNITVIGEIDTKSKKIKKQLTHSFVNHINHTSKQNLNCYIEKSEAILMISRWEGFPRVIIEALLLGKNVFTTDSFPMSSELQSNGFIEILPNNPIEINTTNYSYNKNDFEKYILKKIEQSNDVLDDILKL